MPWRSKTNSRPNYLNIMNTPQLIPLTNVSGMTVVLTNVGAGIQKLLVPDRNGRMADVVFGYEDAATYVGDGPCAGKIPGRYANRIASGRFSLDGHDYTLAVNCGPNALHGGPTGFHNQVWTIVSQSATRVVMQLESADGHEGYPGNVTVRATYEIGDDNRLSLTMEAVSDAPTVINLTNHAYFNLGGHNAGSCLNHRLWLKASRFLATDDSLVPLPGEPAPVVGTPMDFTTAKALGADIEAVYEPLKLAKGYDHCFVLDDYRPGIMQQVARLSDPASGRFVTISTDQPAVQVYTGNWLDDSPEGKDHYRYHDYDCVAIECQDYPDAPNRPDFPSTELRPGQTYRRHIEWRFGCE